MRSVRKLSVFCRQHFYSPFRSNSDQKSEVLSFPFASVSSPKYSFWLCSKCVSSDVRNVDINDRLAPICVCGQNLMKIRTNNVSGRYKYCILPILFNLFVEVGFIFWFEWSQLLYFQLLVSIAWLTQTVNWCKSAAYRTVHRRDAWGLPFIQFNTSLCWDITVVVTILVKRTCFSTKVKRENWSLKKD